MIIILLKATYLEIIQTTYQTLTTRFLLFLFHKTLAMMSPAISNSKLTPPITAGTTMGATE